MKKALAILSSPKTLCDFFWFYVEYGKEYEWDAYIQKGFILSEGWLKKTELFQTIYVDDTDLTKTNPIRKFILAFQMLVYKLINCREKFARKIIKNKTNEKEYDLYIVVPYSMGLLPGLVFLLGKEKEVVILEDGLSDYTERPNKWEKTNPHNMLYLASFLFAKMGYADLTFQYDLDSYRYCIKCSSNPMELEYKEYKEIRTIGTFTSNNQKEYNKLINKTFDIKDISDADVVLYTSPLNDITDDEELLSIIISKTQRFIDENYSGSKLILKKHPRDETEYVFCQSIQVVEIDNIIPGEIIEELLANKNEHIIISMYVSTILQHISNDNYIVLYYKDLEDGPLKMPYKQEFLRVAEKCSIYSNKIVEIA